MSSIRRQLNSTLIRAIAAIECAGLAGTYLLLQHDLTEQLDALLATKAAAISTVILGQSEAGARVNFTEKFLRGFNDKDATDFYELWGGDGRVLLRSETLGTDDLPRRVRLFPRTRHWSLRLPNGQSGRALGVEFAPSTRPENKTAVARPPPGPGLQLVVATNREELDELLHRLLALVLGAGVLILGATALIVPYALRRGLRPLDQLTLQTGEIDAQSLGQRFATEHLPAELLPITQKLNALLTRLQAAFERERRVSADLAHELRTPVAELRILAESALKWPETRDSSTDREALAIATQMERVVHHMLTLARMESGQIELQPEPIDLSVLVETAWRPFSTRAADKALVVAFALSPLPLTTDVALWKAILANLFDNAVDYTPPGGQVRIRTVMTEKGRAVLLISNETEGLTSAEVASLFERFWRKECARSGGSHLGLGLSLVQAFARALGWDVSAQLGDDGYLVIELTGETGSR